MAWMWFPLATLIGIIRVALSDGLTFGADYDFPCHCNNGSCSQDNGFCSSGCQSGWFGPGCQIGNLASGQPAKQSSTMGSYVAYNAVDGAVPEDIFVLHCTHTDDSNASAWWYVTLNETRSYVIINVTIINRQGDLGSRLSNFSILVSELTDGNPHPSNWTLCIHWNGSASYNDTYTCPALTVGRRVAIYLYGGLQSTPGHTLTLCEVGVYGYLYDNCSSSMKMGPGCLLESCNSSSCLAKNGSCGPLNSCEFPECPNSTTPPDCWQTIPSLETASMDINSTCDSVSISLSNTALNGSNFGASYLALEVDNPTNASSQQFNLSITNYSPVPITFPSEPNQSYILRVTPIVCTDGTCIAGTPSNRTSANVGRRFLSVSSYNNTCLSVQVNSSTAGCALPTNYTVTCATQNNTTSSDSSTICGLHPEEAYNCSIQTVLYSGKVEHFDLKLNASDANLAYTSTYNGACLSVSVNCTTAGCTLPIISKVTCATQNNTMSSYSSTICGLHPEEAYNCSIQTVLYGGKVEHFDLKLNASDANLAYTSFYNGTCLSVSVNCTTAGCTLPIIYKVTCATQNDNMSSNGSTICGLRSEEAYNCSIQTVVYGGRVEHFYTKLTASAANLATLPRSETDNLASSIVGGSVTAAVIVLVALSTVAAYLVSRRKARLGRNKASAVDIVPLPSDAAGQVYFNGNASLRYSVGDSDSVHENVTGITREQFDQKLPAQESHAWEGGTHPENKQSEQFKELLQLDYATLGVRSPDITYEHLALSTDGGICPQMQDGEYEVIA